MSLGPQRQAIHPQRVDAPLTSSATFLTLTINHAAPDALPTVRNALASLSDLSKNVGIRDLSGALSCTAALGASAWDALCTDLPKPKELKTFAPIHGAKHTAPSTPGDLLFHIRAERNDLCFEFERQLLDLLRPVTSVQDRTAGFRYFDLRDLLGFVDGTANPTGPSIPDSVIVTASDDPAGVEGSYIVTQKYLHDLAAWRGLSTEKQESIIGRTKLDNIELPDPPEKDQQPHKSLTTISDPETGVEYDILRDNMPFGDPSKGEFGTYFIGYTRRLWVLEEMLRRMFVGVPEGLHDRILDYSRAVTGSVWFAPSAEVLEGLGD